MEESKRKSATEAQNDVKDRSTAATISKTEAEGVSQKSKSVSSSATEQDLDVFLLGDLGDSDDGPGIPLIVINFYVVVIVKINDSWIIIFPLSTYGYFRILYLIRRQKPPYCFELAIY